MIGEEAAEQAQHRFWLLIDKAEQHDTGMAARPMGTKITEADTNVTSMRPSALHTRNSSTSVASASSSS